MRQPKVTLATPISGEPYRFYTWTFTLDPYGWKVTVCYSTNIKAARNHKRFVKLMGEDRDPDRTSWAFCTSIEHRSVLFLPMAEDGKVVSSGVIAHEALHAVKACLERTGVGTNEEAECYLLQHIVDIAYEFGSLVYKYEKEVIHPLTPEEKPATLQKIDEAK